MQDSLFHAQLKDAGTLLERLRKHAGMTKVRLAEHAGIHPRTIRRIEEGVSADLNSYGAIGHVLGLPPDWFLRAEELLDPADGEVQAVRDAERSVEYAAATGWYGPGGIALIRELHDFAREHPDVDGELEIMSGGWRADLRRRAVRAGRRGHGR